VSSNIIPFPARRTEQAASAAQQLSPASPRLQLVRPLPLVQVPPAALDLLDEIAVWVGRMGKRMVAYSTRRAAKRIRGVQ